MRTLHADTAAILNDDNIRPAWLAALEFESGWLYVWTGSYELDHDGKTWLPVGGNGMIEQVGETDELRASGINLTLSGIPSNLLGLAIGSVRQGKAAQVFLALLDGNDAIVGDAIEAFGGDVDAPRIEDNGDTATITIAVESELVSLQQRRTRRYTHEDQQQDYPGDDGFKWATAVASGGEVFATFPQWHPGTPGEFFGF